VILRTIGAAACALLLVSCTGAETLPSSEQTSSPAGTVAPEADPSETTDALPAATNGACGIYLPLIEADPTVVASERLSPGSLAAPVGVTFPATPSCEMRVEQNGPTVSLYQLWDQGDFEVTLDALTAAGFVVMNTSETSDGGRAYMLTGPGEQGLYWLDSGTGITAGVPAEGLMFVSPG
jgi:hypothetical protein